MPTVITSELMHAFAINTGALGSLLACFFYAYASMQIPAGLMCDRYGPKACLSVAVSMCALATMIMYYTSSYYIACLARFIIGAVSACAFVAPLTLASRWYPADKQALITGLVQLMGCAGALFAGTPTAYITAYLGWRATLFWSAVIGVFIGLLFLLILQDHPDAEHIISDANADDSNSNLSISERLLMVVSKPQNWAIGCCAFGSWAPVTVFAEFLGVPYLRALQGISTESASLQISWVWIAMAIASPIAGWASNYLQKRKLPLQVLLSVGLIASGLLIFYPPISSPLLMSILLFCIGVASSAQPITFGLIHDNNDSEVIATAMSFNNMVLISSGCILQPLVGSIVSLCMQSFPGAELFAYKIAFALTPASVLVSLTVLQLYVQETHCQKRTDASTTDTAYNANLGAAS